MNAELNNLVTLCQDLGHRNDFIQGAGGNISVKLNSQLMAIKASGKELKNTTTEDGIVTLNYPQISSTLSSFAIADVFSHEQEEEMNKVIDDSTQKSDKKQKASIETAMHTILDRYVIHTHPVYLNVIFCAKEAKHLFQTIFPETSFTWIPSKPPGLYLAKQIANELKVKKTQIICLESHGLITHSDSMEEALQMSLYLNQRTESFIHSKGFAEKFVPLVKREDLVGHKHVFPDTVVFESFLEDERWIGMPKAKQESILEVFAASHYIQRVLKKLGLEPKYIKEEMADYIISMSREKHRQKLFK